MAFEESLIAAPFLAFGAIILFLIIIIVGILGFVAWIWMIVDCSKRKKFKQGDRVMWILLLVLTGFIGMILYYFMEVRD